MSKKFIGLALAAAFLVTGILVFPAQAAQRDFHILAVEPKGTTSATSEPFPSSPLPGGGGYVLKEPNKDKKWQVSSYVFLPQQIIVQKGDDVILRFTGINGKLHSIHIDHYSSKVVKLNRGRMRSVRFKADKAGVFAIKCTEHLPSMRGELIVLGN